MPSSARGPISRRRVQPDRPSSTLRAEIARWFSAASAARVTRFGRIYPGGSRYVCVSARNEHRGGFYALYFFHHGVDDWRTYPPSGVGPSIVYWSSDAGPAQSARVAPG